jgi:hypothetical protein
MAILLNNSFHTNYLGMAFSVLVRETRFHNSLIYVRKNLLLTVRYSSVLQLFGCFTVKHLRSRGTDLKRS